MVSAVESKTTGIVLDVARQLGGAMPGVVTLHDHSRFGNHGAMTDVAWVQLPTGLWVMSFNGATSYVDCGDDSSVDIVNAITLESWVYPTTLVDNNWLSRDDNANRNYSFYSNAAGDVYITMFTGGVNKYVFLAGALTINNWFHVVGTYNGAIEYLYINGISVGTPNAWVGTIDNDDVSLTIGAREDAFDREFLGYIAPVRIYNYALTAGQILKRYEADKWKFGVN